MNLQTYAEKIHKNAVKKGFWDEPRNFGEMIALQHSELSEALEAHREGSAPVEVVDGKPEGTAVELADALIRILDTLYDMLDGTNYTVDEVVQMKMTYNKSREHMHGKGY